jgi:hypothetical protein
MCRTWRGYKYCIQNLWYRTWKEEPIYETASDVTLLKAGCDALEWVDLALDGTQWQSVMNSLWEMLMMFFWVKSPWGLVGRSQRFGEACCMLSAGLKWWAGTVRDHIYRVVGGGVWFLRESTLCVVEESFRLPLADDKLGRSATIYSLNNCWCIHLVLLHASATYGYLQAVQNALKVSIFSYLTCEVVNGKCMVQVWYSRCCSWE